MKNQVTIIMYHYIRELKYTMYPQLKALLETQFVNQLSYIEKYYQFVTMDDVINAIYGGTILPKNSILLTFDDAYIEHFSIVFPILEEKKIQGCFFPPAQAIMKNKVLDVNKLHFIIASSPIEILIRDLFEILEQEKSNFSLETTEFYKKKYFIKHPLMHRNDSKEVGFFKIMLQVVLIEKLRNKIVDILFKKHVSNDEKGFSKQLYMSMDQMKCMIRNGMYFGSHGYSHSWLSDLSNENKQQEINLSLKFLNDIGASTNNWVMCYPKGAYNDDLIKILKENKCKLGLTTNADIAELSLKNAFMLQRLDTNDLPKNEIQKPNHWTEKVL